MKAGVNSKLIVVDGLPGSGKTPTAQWLELQLRRNQVGARWLHEADIPHPLWWYKQWDGTNYLPPDFEHIPIAAFIETSIDRWAGYVASAKPSGKVNVAESVLFMNAIGMLLMGGAEPAELVDYARRVQEIVRDLDPALIYLYRADVEEALHETCARRGQAFEDELLGYMESFPYLKRRGLKGLDGVAVLWRAIRKLTDALYAEYTIHKLALEVSDGHWQRYRQQILETLGLSFVADEQVIDQRDLSRLAGSYRIKGGEVEQRCEVVFDRGSLMLSGPGSQAHRLIPIDASSFYRGFLPVIVTFAEDTSGIVRALKIDSTRLGGGQERVWTRDDLS